MRKFFLSVGIFAAFGILCSGSFGGSGGTRSGSETRSVYRVPTFTLDQAILTALQRNPVLLNAEQEIKRTKGVIIQVRAQVLPKVNEQSVHLLEAQLKDQQNRFEAGTVPRFNVLQAEIALFNQLPLLITAQNNLRITKITLAKTLGLDFQPGRGENPPLEVLGEMPYIPRTIELASAIEMGKERRPFLKQARANVLNQLQQVRATAGQWLPTVTATGGGEWVSSPINSSWHDISKGWLTTVQGSVPIWDSGAIAGQVIQQRALLSETKITYDDDVRQVELEIQQAYSILQQNRELIQSQEKNVELADEALRLAKARLDAGAGVQLDVLNAQVQLLTAQSTRLQALFGYNSSLAEFDRATGAQSTYHEMFANLAPRATKTKTYYTGTGVDAEGKPKQNDEDGPRIRTGRSRTSSSK